MASNFYTSSPTVVLPTTIPTQYFNPHYGNGMEQNDFNNTIAKTPGSIPATPGSLAGRKRSRGDIVAPEDEEGRDDDGSIRTPMDDAPESIYGPGMTVIHPNDAGYAVAAESQSGTWAEEASPRKTFQLHHSRPSFSSRKSQRTGHVSTQSDDLAQLVLPPQMREATTEPLIDEATRLLGISWTRMDSREALQINQAAYQKWIQNFYPGLKDVQVWFENSAIPCYLVQANTAHNVGYYLFSNDLTEARLITTEPAQLIPRLKMLPAIHLAAPGGVLRAEMNQPTQDQTNADVTDEVDSASLYQNTGCAAHSMELD